MQRASVCACSHRRVGRSRTLTRALFFLHYSTVVVREHCVSVATRKVAGTLRVDDLIEWTIAACRGSGLSHRPFHAWPTIA